MILRSAFNFDVCCSTLFLHHSTQNLLTFSSPELQMLMVSYYFILVSHYVCHVRNSLCIPLLKGVGTYCFWDGSPWRQHKTSCVLCNSVEQDETTCHVQEWQHWLFYLWSDFPLFCLILCPLCNLNTFQNILMVHSRNVEQDKTMCHMQDWQFYLSNLWHYLPLLYLTDLHWFHVCSVSGIPFGIFFWYLVEMKNRTK